MKKLQHLHLIIRAIGDGRKIVPSVNMEKLLNLSLERLVSDIGMKVVLPARCFYVSASGNEGYTGQVAIETSHIAYHIWDDLSLIQFDLYTCGDLTTKQIQMAMDWVVHWMGTGKMDFMVLNREKGITPVLDFE